MRVLITGGSGFLGINLARYLLNLGHEIVILDREDFNYPEIAKVEFVLGDIRDRSAVIEALKDVDAVVHTAAALPLHSDAEIWDVEVNGTRVLLESSLDAAVKRFVHISSTAVYGVPAKHPIFEDDPLIGVGAYGRAKIEAEKLAASFRNHFPVTILRPKSFIGPERLGIFAILYDWAFSGVSFPIPGAGDNLYQYLDVEDLCQAISLSLEAAPSLASDTFNLGAKDFSTFKSDFQSVLDMAGHGRRVVSLPIKPMIWGLAALRMLKLSPVYPWIFETATKDSFVSIDKASERLGFAPRYSNRQALARNYEWYVANRDELSKIREKGKTHRRPWSQGILRLGKFVFRFL